MTTWSEERLVTGVYYADQIRKLRAAIKQKRRGKFRYGVLLHHDNAHAHTSAVAMATIQIARRIRQIWLQQTAMCCDL